MPMDPDTLRLFLAGLERFVNDRLIPNEARVADDDEIPEELIREIRGMGLFGLSIPEEHGPPGLTLRPRDRKMGQKGAHTCDVILLSRPT